MLAHDKGLLFDNPVQWALTETKRTYEFDNPAQWALTETTSVLITPFLPFDNPAQWALTETFNFCIKKVAQ